jgi:hypothetical protein
MPGLLCSLLGKDEPIETLTQAVQAEYDVTLQQKATLETFVAAVFAYDDTPKAESPALASN